MGWSRLLLLLCWAPHALGSLINVRTQSFSPQANGASSSARRLHPDDRSGNPFLAGILAGRFAQSAVDNGRQALAQLQRLDARADAAAGLQRHVRRQSWQPCVDVAVPGLPGTDPRKFLCEAYLGNYTDEARRFAEFAQVTSHAATRLNGVGGGRDLTASVALVETDELLDDCPKRSNQINCLGLRYRSIDGLCNNVERPWWGAALEPLNALLKPAFDDSMSAPRTLAADGQSRLASPQDVLRAVHLTPDSRRGLQQGEVSFLFLTFAHMVYEDMAHFVQWRSAAGECLDCCGAVGSVHAECDVGQQPGLCLPYVRLLPGLHTDCALKPRSFANTVTSYLDGSAIYGADNDVSSRLRAFEGGRLRAAETAFGAELPPPAAANADKCRSQSDHLPCFDFGAYNQNYAPDTAALGILWLRQHNLIAAELATLNPHWNDDRLFEETRRIVVAQLQHITFREFLPLLLGRETVYRYGLQLERSGPHYGYERSRNAQASLGFPTAGLFYLSMLADDAFDTLATGLYNPSWLYFPDFIERVLTSVCVGGPNRVDRFTSDLLFFASPLPGTSTANAVEALLFAGRDGAVPPYLRYREACNLPRVDDFNDLRQFMDRDAVEALQRVYRSVEDIDLYTGGLAERQLDDGIVGPTFACILATQFQSARDGDRFWYENYHYPSAFAEEQLAEIRKISLARIICDHTELEVSQCNAMLLPDAYENCPVSCHGSIIPTLDLSVFADAEPRVRLPVSRDTIDKALALGEQLAVEQNARLPAASAPAVQSASFFNFAVLHPLGYSIDISRVAAIFLEATRLLATRPELFDETLPDVLDANVLQSLLPAVDVGRVLAQLPENKCLRRTWPCDHSAPFRAISGWCNNLKFAEYGSSFVTFRRLLPPVYDDGFNEPRIRSVTGALLPSARAVSARVHRVVSREHAQYSHFVMQWGQFLDHDITFTPVSPDARGHNLDCSACDSAETESVNCFPIAIPADDPFFPPRTADGRPRCLPFARSLLGQLRLGFRQQTNQITSFIDASNVYGSDDCTARQLRSFSGGQLKMQEGAAGILLPPNAGDEACQSQVHTCFHAGDVRVNEQIGLASVHTIWMREHNRIAARLQTLNGHWDDERVYQETRRIIVAFHQHVTFNEFLPKVVGWKRMDEYDLLPERDGFFTRYDDLCEPTISNEFATAAYRFGHTLIQSQLRTRSDGVVRLRDVFFKPDLIFGENFIDSFFQGMAEQPAEQFDSMFSEDVAQHLFEVLGVPFTGLDLAALNVQRARDHGIPAYARFLERFGLPVPRTFEQLRGLMRNESVDAMRFVYASVDDIDLFTGIVSEWPEEGAIVGPTTAHILSEQFRRQRHCDRFWYENGNQAGSFTAAQLSEVRKTTLAKTICRHAPAMTSVQPQIFSRPDSKLNSPVKCEDLEDMDLTHWRDEQNCRVDGRTIAVGEGEKVSPCVSCTCTRDGVSSPAHVWCPNDGAVQPVCHTFRVANCFDLINAFPLQAVLADDACVIQCHAFVRLNERL